MAVTKIELLPSKKLMVKVQKTKNNIKKQLAINKELSDLANHWKEIMAQTDSFNKSFHTYTLAHITIEDYGYHCRIYAPWGMALEGLEKLKPVIETGLKCIFKYEIPDHKDFAMVDIIKPEQVKCNDIPFTPVKVKPYELFAGVDIKGKPILFDINNTPHILLGGATRKGKNGSLNHMLISLIYSCNENEVELYLLQCAKSDLVMYEDCKQVKCCIFGDLEKMNEVLDYIISEIQRRSDLLKPMIKRLEGDNILHYNNLHPKNKLSYIYIVVDEIMVLMLESATKEIKEMKDSILSKLQQVAEFGGATGITYISCHQKPESKLMPTFLKNMSLCRVSFGFTDDVCGRIVLGDKYGDLVIGLPARRAYYLVDDKCDMLFTTNLKGRIEQFIKPSFRPGHRTIFNILEGRKNLNNDQLINKVSIEAPMKQPSGKVSKMEFDKVIKTKEEILKENCAKISGFVPYEPKK